MFIEEQFNYLKKGLSSINIVVSDEQLHTMLKYKDIVLEKNKVMNLTSVTEDSEFILLHIIDSLTVLPYISDNAKLIDIGSGAGFPGMILKIAREDLQITLLDSVKKKVTFLEESIDSLNLEKINCEHGRAEDIAHDPMFRQSYDIAISRAVAPLNMLNELCIPFVKKGGMFIAMKSKSTPQETNEARESHFILGSTNPKILELQLPYNEAERSLLFYEKEKDTPDQYPRSPKKIRTNPLS